MTWNGRKSIRRSEVICDILFPLGIRIDIIRNTVNLRVLCVDEKRQKRGRGRGGSSPGLIVKTPRKLAKRKKGRGRSVWNVMCLCLLT